MSIEELWRPIPDFQGYEASSEGRVRSWKTGHHGRLRPDRPPRMLRPYLDRKDGHLRLQLWRDGVPFKMGVHRAVALAFFGEPDNPSMEASHINSNPLDNRPANLAWEPRGRNNVRRYLAGQPLRRDERGRFRPGGKSEQSENPEDMPEND